MDLNVQIINNVKKYPQLYQRRSNVAERQRLWKILADSMKLEEQFLKSRWYILRERYTKELQNDAAKHRHRKYSKELAFLKEHIALRSAEHENKSENMSRNWIKPEFVITAEDLEWKAGNDSEGEEIYFLNTEEEHMEEQHIEEVEHTIVLEEEIPFEQTTEAEQDPEQMPEEATQTEESVPAETGDDDNETTVLEVNARNVLRQVPEKKVIVEKIPIKQEAAMESNEEETAAMKQSEDTPVKTTEYSGRETVKQETSYEPPVQSTRCEDAIFGELVAAMLKTMESTKKKAVKKEIMNLLLS